MSRFLLLYVAFLQLWSPVSFQDDQQEIKVKPGVDVTLLCQSPEDTNITVLEWIRPDLKTDGFVFFLRENRSYGHYQHPSFRGRVQLRDPEMKDGNVSVILKNVTINDTGTYECHVSVNSTELIYTTINLTVSDSAGNTWTEGDKDGGDKDEGDKDEGDQGEGDIMKKRKMVGYIGVAVGLSVGGVLLVIVIVGFCICRKPKSKKQISYQSPAETSDVY